MDARVTPLGLYYIGALLLEKGYNVDIINFAETAGNSSDIEHVLREKQPDIIGISVFNANRWGGIDTAAIAKRLNPGVTIVFGGVGATFLWRHFLTHFDAIDYIVIGEGEYTFLNLVRHLEQGNPEPPRSIHGLAFRDGGRIHKTDPADKNHDLDALPQPAKHYTFQHVSLMRGCPGKCRFCGSPDFWGSGAVRSHSPSYFVDQLELLAQKGTAFFYVSDDTFTINTDRVLEICREIIGRRLDITWIAISRVDRINEDVLYWMRMAGCTQISFGVESGSAEIRKRLGKPIEEEKTENAFRCCTAYGILPRAYFIYGSPGETWETIGQTLRLMRLIRPLAMISYLLVVFPGTELYREYKTRKQVTDDIWLDKIEDVPWIDAEPGISPELARAFGKKIRDEFRNNLAGFVDAIDLVDQKDMYEKHADFLSRLALTFSHGDYADMENSIEVAERLFNKALTYFPDSRAYLGLGMLLQKKKEFTRSIAILEQGLSDYPENENLHLCMGLNWMNLGGFKRALCYLLKLKRSPQVSAYIDECNHALGDAGNPLTE